MTIRQNLRCLLAGILLTMFSAQAKAQIGGMVTECEFGNVVDTYRICAVAPNGVSACETMRVVVDTFSHCTTYVLPPVGGYGFTGPGGGGGGGGGVLPSAGGVDQDGDDVTDCWKDLTLNSSAPITSSFGQRTDPFTGALSNHNGTDIAVSTGTGLRAGQNGVVAEVYGQYSPNTGSGNGNFVRINYADGTQGVYLHMETVGVAVGQLVTVGQYIGTSNNTGSSTGPHLHYSIWNSSNHGNGNASDLTNFSDPEVVHGSCGP